VREDGGTFKKARLAIVVACWPLTLFVASVANPMRACW